MPSSIIRFITLMTLVGASLAAIALGPSPVHPDHPGKCWSNTQKKSFMDGAVWQEPNCVQVSCTLYKTKLYLEYFSCPSVGVPPGCTTTRDMSLSYPSCCPMPYCPETPKSEDLLGEDYDDFTNWISEYYDQQTQVE